MPLAEPPMADEETEWLDYPRDFFHRKSGTGPKTDTEALRWWPYRRDRPRRGTIDHAVPNGHTIRTEVEDIRRSLRNFISEEYINEVRQRARDNNLVLRATNDAPLTPNDIKRSIVHLENNVDNQLLIYRVFHEFHKSRSWLSSSIDKWLAKNKMRLLPDLEESVVEVDGDAEGEDEVVSPKTKKKYSDDRGGFGAVGRIAKSQAVQRFMTPLFTKMNWCIALTKYHTKGGIINENKHYRPVMKSEIHQSHGSKKREVLYYVVTYLDPANNDNITAAPPINDPITTAHIGDSIKKTGGIDYEQLASDVTDYFVLEDHDSIDKDHMKFLIRKNIIIDNNTDSDVLKSDFNLAGRAGLKKDDASDIESDESDVVQGVIKDIEAGNILVGSHGKIAATINDVTQKSDNYNPKMTTTNVVANNKPPPSEASSTQYTNNDDCNTQLITENVAANKKLTPSGKYLAQNNNKSDCDTQMMTEHVMVANKKPPLSGTSSTEYSNNESTIIKRSLIRSPESNTQTKVSFI